MQITGRDHKIHQKWAFITHQGCVFAVNEMLMNSKLFFADFHVPNKIPRLSKPPSPLEFYRNFVSTNTPCVIENAVNSWTAFKKWKSDEYLSKKLGNQKITVALTPNVSPSRCEWCFCGFFRGVLMLWSTKNIFVNLSIKKWLLKIL